MTIIRINGTHEKVIEKCPIATFQTDVFDDFKGAFDYLAGQPLGVAVQVMTDKNLRKIEALRDKIASLQHALIPHIMGATKNSRRATKSINGEISSHNQQIGHILHCLGQKRKGNWFIRISD